MTLLERLEHFQEHQSTNGDEYGADVLYHAQKRIKWVIEQCEDPEKRTLHTQSQMVAFLEEIRLELKK